MRRHLGATLDAVEIGIEEVPLLPDDWSGEVPLSTHVAARRRRPARVVVYRLPVTAWVGGWASGRGGWARDRVDTVSFVLDLLVEELANLLMLDPDELDPRLR